MKASGHGVLSASAGRRFVSFLHLLDASYPRSGVHILSEQTMKQRAVELESEGLALDGQGHATRRRRHQRA